MEAKKRPKKKWLKIRSTQEILDLRLEKINSLQKELASLKEVVRELIPIAERMKSACESGETLCFDNEYDLRDATEYQKVIDRAKRISDNK